MPNEPTDIFAPDRCWACGWRCWGCAKLGVEDPHGKDRKRLVTFVEIDRCATDAVAVVTGCRLGKRALKFRDWGKVAATFVDVSTGKAIRVAAKESSKDLARQMHPEIADKNQQQMLAYREIADDDLFTTQWVKVELPPEEFPGYKGERVVCEMHAEKASISAAKCVETGKCFVAPALEKRTTVDLGRLLVGMRQEQNGRFVEMLPQNLQTDGKLLFRLAAGD